MISYLSGHLEEKLKSLDFNFLHTDNKSELNDFKREVKGFNKQKVVISLVGMKLKKILYYPVIYSDIR